jgi:hypothetical protein
VSRNVVVRARTVDLCTMEQKGLRTGHFVALAGALAAFGSLWRPWYSITIPAQLRDMLSGGQIGQDPGLLGQMARGLAAALPAELSASGWKELEGADVAVALGALAVVALVLGAAGALGSAIRVDPGACGSLIAAAGAAGIAIALAHVVHKPGGGTASDYVHVADGLWIALAGSAAVLIGGLMAAAKPADGTARASAAATAFPRLDPELPPVFAPAPGTGAHSVPPPGA